MPITLITGTPGAGKSLFAVKMLMEDILPTGRPVFTNINGFSAPEFANLTLCGADGPMKWPEFPEGSFCVFDEIQDQYPFKNGMSQTPAYIRAYEKHRHKGMDFVFITQGPYLLDRHLHPLIDRHFHVYRPFGFKRSTVKEWQGINPTPAPLQSNTNAAIRNFNFPKKYFANYKSATMHTVKARFPWRLGLIGLAMVGAICAVLWQAWGFSQSRLLSGSEGIVEAAAEANTPEGAGTATGPCALVVGSNQTFVRTRISGHDYVLRRDAVSIGNGLLTVGGQEALAWPLCRSAG